MAYRKGAGKRKYNKKRKYGKKKTYNRRKPFYKKRWGFNPKRNYAKRLRGGVILRPVYAKTIPALTQAKIDTFTLAMMNSLQKSAEGIAATAAIATNAEANKKRAIDPTSAPAPTGAMAM